jgi:cation transport ATPase
VILELQVAARSRPQEERMPTGAPEVTRALDDDRAPPLVERLSFRIEGISGAQEARRLERELRGLEGVLDARIDPARTRLTLSLCGTPHGPDWWPVWLDLRGVLAVPEAGPGGEEISEERRRIRRVALRSAALALLGLAMGAVRAWVPELGAPFRAMLLDIQALLTAALALWGARPAWQGMLSAVLRGKRAPDALPFLAGLGAFLMALGFFLAGEDAHFEPALCCIGGTAFARHRLGELARSAQPGLAELEARLRADVRVVRREGVFRVHPESLVPGDILLLGAGETLPADGVAVEGEGVLDGTGVPGALERQNVETSTEVSAGMCAVSGRIAVRVSGPPLASSLARRLEELKGPGGADAWLEGRAVLGVRLIAWAAVLAALAVLGSWWHRDGLGFGVVDAFWTAIACLAVGAPLAEVRVFFPTWRRALGEGARGGALFRNAESLSQFAEVGDAVLEGPGVLTGSDYRVLRFEAAASDAMAVALSLADLCPGPWARAIATHARSSLEDVNAAPEIANHQIAQDTGVRGVLGDGRSVALGTPRLATEVGVAWERGEAPRNVVLRYLLIDGRVAATIWLGMEPALEPGARELVRALEIAHVRTSFVTPEDHAHAAFLGETLGIHRFEALSSLFDGSWRRVAPLGAALLFDGWRDAPPAAPGSVPVRIGEGDRRSAGDVPLHVVSHDLGGAIRAFRIARKLAGRTLTAHILLAGYHVAAWTAVGLGLFGPTEAAAAATVLTLAVIVR